MEKIYQIPIVGNKILLYRFKGERTHTSVYMEGLTQDEYDTIKNRPKSWLNRDNRKIDITDNTFIGKFNINDENFVNYLNSLFEIDEKGKFINSKFDFEASTISTTDGIMKGYPTWIPSKYIKYCYCQIGKPKYVIIYSYICYNYKKNGTNT